MELTDIIPAEAQEYLVKAQFRMDNEHYGIDNDHYMMALDKELKNATNVALPAITVVGTDARYSVLIAGDEVDILPVGKDKIRLELKGIELKGRLKAAVVKKLIEHNGVVDMYAYNEWETYIFVHNGYMYKAGFNNGDYGLVCSLKDYRPRPDYNEPTVEEYYKKYKMSQRHNYGFKTNVQTDEDIVKSNYGDNETGLGTMYTDPIREELLECIEFIAKVKDKSFVKDMIDDLSDMLSNG